MQLDYYAFRYDKAINTHITLSIFTSILIVVAFLDVVIAAPRKLFAANHLRRFSWLGIANQKNDLRKSTI